MKAFTDLDQSKKLAEILPLESADMYYHKNRFSEFVEYPHFNAEYKSMVDRDINYNDEVIPCWSLAALLAILTKQDFIIKTIGNEFNIDIPIRHCKIWFSSLLDAAFEMICWLKENNKL